MLLRGGLVALFTLVLIFIFSLQPSDELVVSFLDVGQGDAIFIESPTGVQLLVDGGATRAVLRELRAQMSFFDRNIDAVVATHPDTDHVGGLSYVLNRYRVGTIVESGADADTPAYRAYATEREKEKAQTLVARRGMRFILGGGAYAEVLFPDRDVSTVEANTASIILRVVYGDHEFLLTGDSPSSIEKYILALYGEQLKSDVLKAGHHGSKTSSDEAFVHAVNPSYVIFSRGCENRYGHPSAEVVTLFQTRSIPALDTCERGTVTFRSNGKRLLVK